MQAAGILLFSRRRGDTKASPVRSYKPRHNQQTWRASMLQMGIQPEKWRTRKTDMGESVSPGTDPISLFFRFAYIPFVTQRDKWKFQSHAGVSSPYLYQNQVLYINIYKRSQVVLHHLLAMRPARHFMALSSDNGQLPENLFFQG